MEGVVSLLDAEHKHKVEAIWAALKESFGVSGVYITPFPHFSYHVAKKYDQAKLAASLQEFAAQTAPFKVIATGLAIFNGPSPILYIPVTRTLELSQLHAAMWPRLQQAGSGAVEYYSPPQWMPHITIGQSDITSQNLGPIIIWLNQQPLTWEIEINSIGTIFAKGTRQYLGLHYELSGG